MHRAAFCLLLIAPVLAGPARAQGESAPRPAGEARVPSLLGATGLLLIPSAYLQRKDQVTAYLGGSREFLGGGVLAGIGGHLEMGLGALAADESFAPGGTRLLVNTKLSLLQETLTLPAFSVGITDAFDQLDQGRGWYAVTSKYLIPYFVRALTGQEVALKLHLGYGGGIYDHDLMAGAELFFPHGLSAMAEYTRGGFNLGGRLHSRGFTATLGLFEWDHLGGAASYTVALR